MDQQLVGQEEIRCHAHSAEVMPESLKQGELVTDLSSAGGESAAVVSGGLQHTN